MKAFLIDSDEKQIKEIDYQHTNYKSILGVIGCDILSCALLDSENALYYGMLNLVLDSRRPAFWMRRMGIHFGRSYICTKGNGLIVAHGKEGHLCDSTLTLARVRDLVSFSEPAEAMAEAS